LNIQEVLVVVVVVLAMWFASDCCSHGGRGLMRNEISHKNVLHRRHCCLHFWHDIDGMLDIIAEASHYNLGYVVCLSILFWVEMMQMMH